MVLHKRNCRLRGFNLRRFLNDHHIVLDMTCHHLIHTHRRAETQRQTHNQTQAHLPCNLYPSVQTVFVLFERLDIVVRKAQSPHQKGSDEHQNHIYVRQLT